jgi:hypothetical protein
LTIWSIVQLRCPSVVSGVRFLACTNAPRPGPTEVAARQAPARIGSTVEVAGRVAVVAAHDRGPGSGHARPDPRACVAVAVCWAVEQDRSESPSPSEAKMASVRGALSDASCAPPRFSVEQRPPRWAGAALCRDGPPLPSGLADRDVPDPQPGTGSQPSATGSASAFAHCFIRWS